MKILYITYYWPPAGGPGVQRAVKFAKFLPEFEINPIIITVNEKVGSYPLKDESLLNDVDSSLKVIRTDTFEPLTLYSRLLKKEVPYSGFANESDPSILQKILRFIRGNFFIPDARRGWNSYVLKEARKIIESENIKAIITSSPPHSTQLIGLELKKAFNIPWIADLRDPWTDIYYYNLMLQTSFAKRLDQKYEREVLENADSILVTNQDTKNLFASKSTAIHKDKIHVIYNGFDESDFNLKEENLANTFAITYSGTIATNYNIDVFIKAFQNVFEKEKEAKVKLRFVGKAAEGIKLKFKGLEHLVEFVPYVPHHESIKYLLSSSVLLLAIPEVKNNEAILPGKLFEYLAARKPVVCLGPKNGDVAKILEECEAGKVFQENDFEKLSFYLKEIFDKWQSNNKQVELLGNKHLRYSRRSQSKFLSEIILKLTENYKEYSL